MLNRSCETCRIKKLRCHGGQPCLLCHETGSECIRVARKKKTMRADRRRTGTAQLPASPSSSSKTHTTTTADTVTYEHLHTLLFTASPPTYDDQFDLHSSTHALTLSASVIAHVAVPPTTDSDDDDDDLHWFKEAHNTIFFCQDACQILLSMSFRWRVLPSVHGCIDMDALLSYSKTLAAAAATTTAPDRRGMLRRDQVALLLLSLSLALLFTPPNGRNADPLRTALSLSPLLGAGRQKIDPLACQRAMYKHALGWLLTCQSASLEAVQCVVLATLHDCENGAALEGLFDRAVRWAMQIDLHRLRRTSEDEMGVRTWWFLVTRNWLAAPRHWTYSLHPSQFATRLPIEADLDGGGGQQTWTPASYSLALISLASTVQRLVDVRNQRRSSIHVQARQQQQQRHRTSYYDVVSAFNQLINTTLPAAFATKSILSAVATEASGPEQQMPLAYAHRIHLERWLLYPQILHCFFALLDDDDDDGDDQLPQQQHPLPALCVTLAHCILHAMHRSMRQCSLLTASELPVRTLTDVATVICVDGLGRSTPGGGGDAAQQQLHSFVKASVAARLVTRLLQQRSSAVESPPQLLQVYRMLDAWRANLSTDAELSHDAAAWTDVVVSSSSSSSNITRLHFSQLELHIQRIVEDYLQHADLQRVLWRSNEEWDTALRWDVVQSGSWASATAAAPKIPSLAAALPAFQVDRSSTTSAWWSRASERLLSRSAQSVLGAEYDDEHALMDEDMPTPEQEQQLASTSDAAGVPLPDDDTIKRASRIAFQHFQFMHLFHPDHFFERLALAHDDRRYPHASALHAILALAYAASPTLLPVVAAERVDAHVGLHYDHYLAAQHHIRRAIHRSIAPDNTLDVIRATLLLVLKAYGQGDEMDAFMFSAQAMRTCVIANLNRDDVGVSDGDDSDDGQARKAYYMVPKLAIANRSSLWPRTHNAIEEEEVRRTMLFAFAVDRTSSLATLWPSTLSEDDYKAELPRASLTDFFHTTAANIDSHHWPKRKNTTTIKSPSLLLELSVDVTQFIFKNFILYGRCAEYVSRLSRSDTVDTITTDERFQHLQSYIAVLHLESLNAVPLLLGRSVPSASASAMTAKMFMADGTKSAMRKLALLGACILPHICTLTLYEPIANLHKDSAEQCRSAASDVIDHLSTCEQYAPDVFDLLDIPVTLGITMTGRTLIRQLERIYLDFIAQHVASVDVEDSPSTGTMGDLTATVSHIQAQLHVVLSCLNRMSRKWHIADQMHKSLLTLLDFHPEHRYRGIFFAGFLPSVTIAADGSLVRGEGA